MPENDVPHYSFGAWRYRSDLRELSNQTAKQTLKPLHDRLLQRLLAEPGAVLSREQLLDQVWTRKQVNDEVLSRAIAELRGLLGDDAREPSYIQTVPKGGYRWIAPTSHCAADPAPPRQTQRASGRTVSRWAALAAVLVVGLGWLLWRLLGAQAVSNEPSANDLLHARPLTAHPELELDPRFDPIGRVVYVRTDPRSGHSALMMVNADGDAERLLWEHSALIRHPTVSPDGAEVALIRQQGDGCEVITINLLNQRQSRITECATDVWGGLEWTADGEQLLHSAPPSGEGYSAGLAVWERRTQKVRALTNPRSPEGSHRNPRLSPDQRHLVYSSTHGNERQLWWTDWPDLTKRQALLARPEPVYQHVFTHDSKALWVAGDLISYRALNRLQPGEAPQLLGGSGAQSVDLHKDGSVVWTEASHDADVWIGDTDPESWRVLAQTNRYESQPAFSPDGRRLALCSNRGGMESVVIVDLANQDQVIDLDLDPQMRWVRPTWSPDGDALLITGYHDGQTRLYRYAIDGHHAIALDELGTDASAGVELPDRLLYLSGHVEQRQLVQRRHDHADSEALPFEHVHSFRASAQWLVWQSQGEAQLHAAPMDQWSSAQPVSRIDPVRREAFAIAGDWLYFALDRRLMRVQLPDGEPEVIADAPFPSAQGSSLAVSASGQIAVAKLEQISMDLMIAGRMRP